MSKISILRKFVTKGWTIANRSAITSQIGKQNFSEISNLALKANLSEDIFEFSKAKDLLKKDVFESTKQALLKIVQNITRTEDVFEGVAAIGVKNLRRITPTCVSGETFAKKSVADLRKLKNAGIDTIVDFRSEATEEFARICEQNGIKYHLFPLDHTSGGLPEHLKGKGVSNKFVQQLKEFIDLTNKGNVYMGCQYGIDRTNLGAVLNYLINPKINIPPKILTWGDFRPKSIINKTVKVARKLVKKMTPEQRQLLGLGEDYNELFTRRINELLLHNVYR